MADVFISYKAEDRRRVQPLVHALQADGYSVWWDEHIGTGDEWRGTIERELDAARCVIVVWSKRSVGPEGHFVRDEASRAQRRHVYVPVLIESVEPPLGFGESQAASLRGWKGDRSDPRYRAVLNAVERIAGQGKPVSDAAAKPAGMDRRAVLAGGAVVTAAVVAAGGWALFKPGDASAASDSIAVLPFANLSGDPAKAYFSDGIAEEIRSALSRMNGLTVIGRISSEAVRNDDAKTAANKLHVGNILTGSVRQSATTIRITAELIDGRTGADRWSQDYDRAPGDAIEIQSDIATQVTNALRAALGNQEELTIGGTTNPAAHDEYLKAVAVYLSGHSQSNFEQAKMLAQTAIDLDPAYADAYALKAASLVELTGSYAMNGDEFTRGFAQAEAAANRAVQLQPRLVAGYLSLARVFNAQLKFRNALKQFEIAGRVGASSADFLMEYANFLCELDSPDRALELAKHAVALDPFNPRALGIEATAYFIGGHYPETIAVGRGILKLSPGRPSTLRLIGDALLLQGKLKEAAAEYAKIPADDLFRLTSESILAAKMGDIPASDRLLARIRALYADAASAQYADIYAQRGKPDEAFAALDEAVKISDPGLAWIVSDPFLDPVKKDPRFAALVGKLNFPAS